MRTAIRRVFNWFGILFLAAFVGLLVYVPTEAWYYQEHLGRDLERDLGFRHGSPYISCGDEHCEVFTIEALNPTGVLWRAGFRDGDIVKGHHISGFYRLLHRNRGSEVTVKVIEGGNGLPLDQRQERELHFVVPAAR